MNKKLTILAIVALLALSTAAAHAAVLNVDGADGGCSDVSGTPYCTIGAAVTAAGPTDTINVAAFTYVESGIAVNKALTIVGAGTGSTIVDPGGSGNIFIISASDVTMKDLTIQNGTQGARLDNSAGIDNTEFNNVEFLNNSSRSIEVHNPVTATNLRVINCLFEGNLIGLRFASTAIGDGILVDGSTFKDHTDPDAGIGIYQANDDGIGYVQNLRVTDSTFINNGFAGIFGEEMRDIEVDNNTFTDNLSGFQLFSIYTTAAVLTGNIWIHHNTFTDSRRAAVLIDTDAFELPVTIEDNTISADVSGLLALSVDKGQQIALRLASGFTHGAVTVRRNTVNFSGAFGTPPSAAYAIEVRGDFDAGLTITENTLQGGGVGDNGGAPPTSGIFLITDDPTFWGAPTSGSLATVDCNVITGFVNGVSAFDENEVTPTFGGLPTGVLFNVNSNGIFGNSGFGINNGGTSETIDAEDNWWGAADGPGVVGPGSGDKVSANVDFVPFATVLPLCAGRHHIDIKPGSDPNSINTKSNGVVPVALLGSATFDVSTIDETTLTFGPNSAPPAHDLTDPPVLADHLQDVNMDGFPDLVSHYRQKQTGLAVGDAQACLMANLTGGGSITACDLVNVVK